MIDPQNTAPHSIDAEQAVLGAVLLSDATHGTLLAEQDLRPEHFYRDRHRVVLAAIRELHEHDDPIDVLTVTEHLRACGKLDEAGGQAEIDALTGAVPALANIRKYGEIVRDLAARRGLLALTYDAQAAIHSSTRTAEAIATHEAALSSLARSAGGRGIIVRSRDEFIALERPETTALVATDRTRALMPGGTLVVASPTGLGKSLALFDLAGKLGSDGGEWFGFEVVGGQRVLFLSLEGDDETTRERLEQLIPPGATVDVVDYWQRGPRPGDRPCVATASALGALIREREYDVVFVDTLTAYLGDAYDLAYGVPESAWIEIERLRRYAGRDFALASAVHTRKPQTTSSATAAEEIAGGIAKKVDAAIVLRADGDSQRRRRVTFAKTRSGPPLPDVIAELPEDEDEPPRFTITADIGAPRFKEGTEAEQIAAQIAECERPQSVAEIKAKFDISDSTLRRRRGELELHGVFHRKLGHSTAYAYGTAGQWVAYHDRTRGITAQPSTASDPPVTSLDVEGQQSPETGGFNPPRRQTLHNNPEGLETPINTGSSPTLQPSTPTGSPKVWRVDPDDLDWSDEQ